MELIPARSFFSASFGGTPMEAISSNPDCNAHFNHHGKGRLFFFPADGGLNKETVSTIEQTHWLCHWLCCECAKTITMVMTADGIALKALRPRWKTASIYCFFDTRS